MDRTKQKFSLAFELEVSTPKSLSFLFSRVVILYRACGLREQDSLPMVVRKLGGAPASLLIWWRPRGTQRPKRRFARVGARPLFIASYTYDVFLSTIPFHDQQLTS